MQRSRYTFRFRVDDGQQILLYNPLTTCMDLIDKPSLRRVDTLIRDGNGDGLADETLAYLLERGYVYRSPEDERDALMRGFDEFKERERKSNLRFVILPTYQCNSRCPYCFIGEAIGQERLMSNEVMDHAFRAMDEIADERGQNCTRQLSLFGGEPLIDTPRQRECVERILHRGAERGFVIDVVSNGFDLVSYIDVLERYQVAKVQVTFDGMRDYHNTRRVSVDGRGPSFDRIVAGIDAALARGVPLNVRTLLDRTSIAALPELVAFFREKGWFDHPQFSTHLGSVFDCFRCQPKEETVKHLGVHEGNRALFEICSQDRSISDLLAIDWQGVRRFVYTGNLFPPTYKTCFGGTRTFAFDPNGGIYACETTAGRSEYQIGSFYPRFELNRDLIDALERRTILTIPGCTECPQALLCAGGCAFNAVVTNGSLFSQGCRLMKDTLQYGFDLYWPDIAERLANSDGSRASETDDRAQEPACCPSRVEDVRLRYADAAMSPATLCCPSRYDPGLVSHIPQSILQRSYGCGSPVLDAGLQPGEVVLDLGSGAGLDCFIAAKHVGAAGHVYGIDATDAMLSVANECRPTVAANLGWNVVEFRKGLLEAIPLEDGATDVVTSNCVINLTTEKSRVFGEICRVLKDYGRAVLADIVTDREVPPSVRADPQLWGECVSGALTEDAFLTGLERAGLYGISVLKKTFWQEIDGCRFSSITVRGFKFAKKVSCTYIGQHAVYLGPLKTAVDEDGHQFPRGIPVEVCTDTAAKLCHAPYAGSFAILDRPDGDPVIAPAPTSCASRSACC